MQYCIALFNIIKTTLSCLKFSLALFKKASKINENLDKQTVPGVCLRFYFDVVNQHSLECLSCKHKNTVFEYEFLIKAKSQTSRQQIWWMFSWKAVRTQLSSSDRQTKENAGLQLRPAELIHSIKPQTFDQIHHLNSIWTTAALNRPPVWAQSFMFISSFESVCVCVYVCLFYFKSLNRTYSYLF